MPTVRLTNACRCEAHGEKSIELFPHTCKRIVRYVVKRPVPAKLVPGDRLRDWKGGDLFLCGSCAVLYYDLNYTVGALV